MLSAPLWPMGGIPPVITNSFDTFLSVLDDDPDWSFWRNWYKAVWDGTYKEWDLAHAVAKIGDEFWEGEGALAKVAAEIEKIKARRVLENEIAKLKIALQRAHGVATAPHRLHNNPPADAVIDLTQGVSTEIVLIWDQLEAVEREVTEPEPSPSILDSIAQSLWDISIRIAAYCGSLADVALKKSAEIIGGTGTKAAITILVTTNESVQSVAKTIWDFVKTLPP